MTLRRKSRHDVLFPAIRVFEKGVNHMPLRPARIHHGKKYERSKHNTMDNEG
jgi:hypothetical protein